MMHCWTPSVKSIYITKSVNVIETVTDNFDSSIYPSGLLIQTLEGAGHASEHYAWIVWDAAYRPDAAPDFVIRSLAFLHHRGLVQGSADLGRYGVFGIVSPDKIPAKVLPVLNRSETSRKIRAMFIRLELWLRIRVVGAGIGSRMRFGHSQIREKMRHRLWSHALSPIGVNRQLAFNDTLLFARLRGQTLGQNRAFPFHHHPADNEATEDI